MKKTDFDGLMKSVAEAKEFARTGKLGGGRLHLPKEMDAARIRSMTGLTQAEFSAQIGVSIATLRNWEQGRRNPDGPARVLLALLAKDPNIVKRTLVAA